MLKQKKERNQNKRKHLVEGVSRKIKRDLEDVIESLDVDLRHKAESLREEFRKICVEIDCIAEATNRCYRLWLGDPLPCLTVKHRNPYVLLKYSRLFMEGLANLREEEVREREERQRENEAAVGSYNPNNVYELIARKNIEFIEMQTRISDLKLEKELSQKRAEVAEEMTEAVSAQSQQLLRAYRENFFKITELLQRAEEKETELLQTNRILNERIENLGVQYDNYKMNFKIRAPAGEGEKRMRERMEKEYEERLRVTLRQCENQMRGVLKVK